MTARKLLPLAMILHKGVDLRTINAAVLFLFGTFAVPSAATAEMMRLNGDRGYNAEIVGKLEPESHIDARTAMFHVANSGTAQPSSEMPCDGDGLPVNRYPLQIRESPGVTLNGGRFAGEVPLFSDWENTYCNSAGTALRGSPGAKMQNIRMRRVWDALRFTEDTNDFVLRGSWVSEVRDDCIENDYLNGGLVEDMLLDGCFSGLSMRPPKGEERNPESGAVVLNGVLMRMQSYLYKGQLRQGPPFKVEEVGPQIEVYDSIVAMDDLNIVSGLRLKIGWARIGACRGNLLLWTADTPWPDDFSRPPDCFQVVEGAAARSLWQMARQNWIDCHPDIVRFDDDPISASNACDIGTYGGHVAEQR